MYWVSLAQAIPKAIVQGEGDRTEVVTILTVGRALEDWGNGGDQHLGTRKNCDLPKIPKPLYGEGPHTAPGATAVLIGAASAREKENAQAGHHSGSEGTAKSVTWSWPGFNASIIRRKKTEG